MDAVQYALDPLRVNGKLGRLSQTHTLPDTAIDSRACVEQAGRLGVRHCHRVLTISRDLFYLRTGSPWIVSTSVHINIKIYQNNGSLSLCASYEPTQRPA